MLGDKSEHFEGKGTDLSALESHLEEYLKSDGFTVQTSPPSDQGTVIQAKKSGFLREVVAAERAFTITITRTSRDRSEVRRLHRPDLATERPGNGDSSQEEWLPPRSRCGRASLHDYHHRHFE